MESVHPAPGTMRLYPADPNPNGAVDSQLFLFRGDATAVPVQKIVLAPAVAFPKSHINSNSPEFHLQIIHFNDLHGHLMHFTPGGEESVLPRMAWQIQAARQSCQAKPDSAVLVISAGDDCGGSIFGEMLMDELQPTHVHPSYQLYAKMGVDVAGLGNHDFDRGILALASAVERDTRFPVLAANLKGCPELLGVCHPAAILVVKGIRVGLIGLVTRAETHLNPKHCQIVDPIPVVNNLVSAIRPLCDVLILISHLGNCLEERNVPMADAGDVEVARSLPKGSVDLIIGGHSHSALNRDGLEVENIVNGVPIVQTGACGEYLGQVDIAVQENSTRVTDVHLIPIASLPVDQDFKEKELQPFINQVREIRNQTLGQVDDNPELNTAVVLRDFARCELALANFITDAMVECLTKRGFLVDFAMIDASALQCGLPFTDNLTYGDCFELMPYSDTLRLYQITGRQLQDLFFDNTLRIDRSGETHIERGFLQFSCEVRYTVDLGQTRADARAMDITIHQTPLESLKESTFSIVTSSFTRELAVPWEAKWNRTQEVLLLDLRQFPYTETDIFLRQEMITYIRDHGGVMRASGAQRDGRLRIRSARKNNHK